MMRDIEFIALGIDPGFADAPTGVALVQFSAAGPHLLQTWKHRGRGKDWQDRTSHILEHINITITSVRRHTQINAIFYELAWVGKNTQTALRMESLGGGVRGLAVAYGIQCLGVAPVLSKQALAGSHKASKQQMQAAAKMLFRRDLSEHEADAIGHALAGEAALRRAVIVQEHV